MLEGACLLQPIARAPGSATGVDEGTRPCREGRACDYILV
jgi:hypothetical protein